MVMDVDAFRMEMPPPAIVGPITGRRKKGATTDPFLAGPVPMWWLARAYRLGAAALAVGLALWHAQRMREGRSGPIKVNAATRRPMGLSHDQARRGVHALHGDRLVAIHVGGRVAALTLIGPDRTRCILLACQRARPTATAAAPRR